VRGLRRAIARVYLASGELDSNVMKVTHVDNDNYHNHNIDVQSAVGCGSLVCDRNHQCDESIESSRLQLRRSCNFLDVSSRHLSESTYASEIVCWRDFGVITNRIKIPNWLAASRTLIERDHHRRCAR